MKFFSFVLIAALAAMMAHADPVSEIDYQGKILVNDQAYTGTGYFKLALSDAGSTTNLWATDELTNEVYNGVFSMILGDASMPAIDPGIFSAGTELYLRVWFSTNGTSFDEMLPSQKLLSAPYAINADRLDGLDSTDFATGTPVYVESDETDPVWTAQKDGYATGTPVYVEADPVWLSEKAGYATGTPLYAYTETDPVFLARTNSIVYTNTAAGGDLSGNYPSPTVVKLQGRAVSANAPGISNVLQWSGSAWTPVAVAASGGGIDPSSVVYTNTSAGGNLSGVFSSLEITHLQNAPLNVYAASPGQYLKFFGYDEGEGWQPAAVTTTDAETDPVYTAAISRIIFTNTAAGGDLGGIYPRPIVTGLQGRAISGVAPTNGSILQWDGTNWTPVTLSSVAGKSYGTVNKMDAPGPGTAFDITGAGGVTITNIAGTTNTVQISSPVPLLQNVIWVATNGTAAGPGNIDSPYATPSMAAGAAYGRYAGQPATVIVAGGIYTNDLVLTNGNAHIVGLNRPIIGKVQIPATADPSLNGKIRLENLVIDSSVDITGSGVKFRNCRINRQVTISGQNVEFQDCAITTNVIIQVSASNVLLQSCSIKKSGVTPYALDIGAAYNVQVIGCEIVNTWGGGAVRGPASAASVPPFYHLSHNVIKGTITSAAANTMLLTHNIIQGRMNDFNIQYFANNVIIGTNNWIQAATTTNDAQGNLVINNGPSFPDPWND